MRRTVARSVAATIATSGLVLTLAVSANAGSLTPEEIANGGQRPAPSETIGPAPDLPDCVGENEVKNKGVASMALPEGQRTVKYDSCAVKTIYDFYDNADLMMDYLGKLPEVGNLGDFVAFGPKLGIALSQPEIKEKSHNFTQGIECTESSGILHGCKTQD